MSQLSLASKKGAETRSLAVKTDIANMALVRSNPSLVLTKKHHLVCMDLESELEFLRNEYKLLSAIINDGVDHNGNTANIDVIKGQLEKVAEKGGKVAADFKRNAIHSFASIVRRAEEAESPGLLKMAKSDLLDMFKYYLPMIGHSAGMLGFNSPDLAKDAFYELVNTCFDRFSMASYELVLAVLKDALAGKLKIYGTITLPTVLGWIGDYVQLDQNAYVAAMDERHSRTKAANRGERYSKPEKQVSVAAYVLATIGDQNRERPTPIADFVERNMVSKDTLTHSKDTKQPPDGKVKTVKS